MEEGDWLAGKQLQECHLNDEGITVLGIYRSDGNYVGAPRKDTYMYEEDTLLLYGREERIRELDQRGADSSGEMAHQRAVSEQREKEAEQEQQEAEHREKRKSGKPARKQANGKPEAEEMRQEKKEPDRRREQEAQEAAREGAEPDHAAER